MIKDFQCFVSDYSEDALKITKELNVSIVTQSSIEDNEKLSFPDNYFDYSFIAAALHHLPRPNLGLYELLRVSKEGIIVIEPNDSFLTKMASKLKFAQEYESTGNYVYRYSKREIEKIANSLFYSYSCKRFFAIHKIAKNKFIFNLLKLINGLLNIILPNQENYIAFFIKKV